LLYNFFVNHDFYAKKIVIAKAFSAIIYNLFHNGHKSLNLRRINKRKITY